MPLDALDERSKRSLILYKEIASEALTEGWVVYFLAGFAIDAHCGYFTRQHGDIDLMADSLTVERIKVFLESKGHVVYEPEEVRGECYKVDQAREDKPMYCHADIHRYWEDEFGRATMPSHGKLLKFSTNARDASVEISFLGVKARFLKLEYLLEEKIGWHNQVGLKVRQKNLDDIEKIKFLISILKD
ncbi:MAG: hypothetical protein K9M11_04655 [Candidatus Pacebacteria bacterium]|nr:hypothetical protein [Candidatus Paceibacterota bacterium]